MKNWKIISVLLFFLLISCNKQHPQSRSLIIQCDDVGLTSGVNHSAIHLLESGVITAASIQVTGNAFPEIAQYAARHPEMSWGLHLTLNGEFRLHPVSPISAPEDVPSLVDSDGHFPQTSEEVVSRAKPEEVERELQAQIQKARDAGISLSHLDSHMGTLYLSAPIFDAFVRVAQRNVLPILFAKSSSQQEFQSSMETLLPRVSAVQMQKNPVLEFLYPGNFSIPPEKRKVFYENLVASLPAGVSEIILHCADKDEELESFCLSARVREMEGEIFSDPTMKEEFRREGIRLISWRELADGNRGSQHN